METSKIFSKTTKSFWRTNEVVLRRIDVEIYHKSKKVKKYRKKHLHCIYVMGHMTSSLHAKMACFVWTEEEIEKFSHVIKAKNITISNVSVLTATKAWTDKSKHNSRKSQRTRITPFKKQNTVMGMQLVSLKPFRYLATEMTLKTKNARSTAILRLSFYWYNFLMFVGMD